MSYIVTASNINSVKNCFFFYKQNSGFLQLLTNYFPRPMDLKKIYIFCRDCNYKDTYYNIYLIWEFLLLFIVLLILLIVFYDCIWALKIDEDDCKQNTSEPCNLHYTFQINCYMIFHVNYGFWTCPNLKQKETSKTHSLWNSKPPKLYKTVTIAEAWADTLL